MRHPDMAAGPKSANTPRPRRPASWAPKPVREVRTPPARLTFAVSPDEWPHYTSAQLSEFLRLGPAARRSLIGVVHPDDLALLTPLASEHLPGVGFQARIRLRRGRTYRWMDVRAEFVSDERGRRWVGAFEPARRSERNGSSVPVGERRPPGRLATDAARAAGDVLAAAAAGECSLMALLDQQGQIVFLDEAWRVPWEAVRPRPRARGKRADFLTFCAAMLPNIDQEAVRQGVADIVEGRSNTFSKPYVDAASREVGREMRISPLSVGSTPYLIVLTEDASNLTRVKAALSDISEQLLSAQESERHRIAIELHDSTSQHLVALGLGLTRLRRILGPEAGAEAVAVLKDMAGSLKEALKDIRVNSYLIAQTGVENHGLRSAARRFVQGFAKRTGLDVRFGAEGPVDDASAEVKHAAFRIIQEALSNAYRHAEATRVDVELIGRDGVLRVRVSDDGKGIEAICAGEQDRVQLGVGIVGMRSRVEQLDGRFEISCAGVGTVVTAILPAAATAGLGISDSREGRIALDDAHLWTSAATTLAAREAQRA